MEDKQAEYINPGEILGHISIKLESEAYRESVQADAEKVEAEITKKYLGIANTAAMRREMHKELGERLRNLPGVKSVLIPALLTANPSTITMGMEINLNTGEIKTDVGFEEGDPVKRPLWSRRKNRSDTDA